MSQDRVEEFRQALRNCGMGYVEPTNKALQVALGNADDDFTDKSLDEAFGKVVGAKIPIMLVILPTKSAPVYNRVKYYGDVKHGIHTVCVFQNNLGKGPQYYGNVALKFNQKLGGSNQCLLPKDLDFLARGKTMIVGMDVTHPAPGSMQ